MWKKRKSVKKKINNKRFGGERERNTTCESERSCQTHPKSWLDPRTWPCRISWFQPPHQPSLVPIKSLWDASHIPAIIVARKRQERWRLSSKELRLNPSPSPSILLNLYYTISWVSLLSLPLSLSDWSCHLKRSIYHCLAVGVSWLWS